MAVYIPSLKEIRYNIEIMEHAIRENPEAAKSIDVGFMEILQTDITRSVQKNGSSWSQPSLRSLEHRLSDVAARIFDAQPDMYERFESVRQPSFCEREDFQNIAQDYTGDLRIGVEKISKMYDRHRIAGDGHCLFRAIASGFLLYSPQSLFNALQRTSIMEEEKYSDLRQILVDILKKQRSARDVLSSKEISDKFVELLRDIAVREIRKKAERDQSYRAVLADEIEMPFAQYLSDMADMEKRSYGGAPEIEALKGFFNAPWLSVLNAGSHSSIDEKSAGRHPFALLRRGPHYDLIMPKNNQR